MPCISRGKSHRGTPAAAGVPHQAETALTELGVTTHLLIFSSTEHKEHLVVRGLCDPHVSLPVVYRASSAPIPHRVWVDGLGVIPAPPTSVRNDESKYLHSSDVRSVSIGV